MKKILISYLSLTCISYSQVIFTTGKIEVSATIKGDAETLGVFGDTLSYLVFEMFSSGEITLQGKLFNGTKFQMAQYLPNETGFAFIGNPYYLSYSPSLPFDSLLPSFTRNLNAGTYVVVTSRGDNRISYDIYDGFVAFNPEGGGFSLGYFGYEIIGDVRPLEFRSGNLDNTFTITNYPVPEPSTYALMGLGLLVIGWFNRRRFPR